MTSFDAAGYRAINLSAALESSAANGTVLSLLVPSALMLASTRTCAAIETTPRRRRSAIDAMLRVLCGSPELSSVFFFVARNAKRNAVVYVGYKFWIIGNRLDVVCMNVTRAAATLASETIAAVHSLTPFSKIAHRLCSLAYQALAAFPCACLFANAGLGGTGSGTETRLLVSAVECLAASGALSWLGRVAVRPTRLRAIMGSIGAVGFDLECRATNDAGFRYLCVLHGRHFITEAHNTQITPSYVALERWATMTGQTPVLEASS